MAVKVSQAIIDEFKKSGMGAAIKKYNSGAVSDEFREAVRRYYPSIGKSGPGGPSVSLDESNTGGNVKVGNKSVNISSTKNIVNTAKRRAGMAPGTFKGKAHKQRVLNRVMPKVEAAKSKAKNLSAGDKRIAALRQQAAQRRAGQNSKPSVKRTKAKSLKNSAGW